MRNRKVTDYIKLYFSEKKLIYDHPNFPKDAIANIFEEVWKTYENNGTIYACGNGGNAAFVANLITDLANHPFVSDDKLKPLSSEIPRLRTTDLCASSASITGIMNDLGPEYIFSQQLINDKITERDLVFGFTGSGNSKNVLEAFGIARRYSAKSIAITRGDGGKAKNIADYCLIIPGTSKFPGQVGGNDNNFHYEDLTSEIAHIITGLMRKRISEKYGDKHKDS